MTAESRPPPSLGIIVLAAFGLTEASLKECSAFHPSLVGRPLRPVRSVHATSSGKAKHCLSVHRKAATTGAGESRTEEHAPGKAPGPITFSWKLDVKGVSKGASKSGQGLGLLGIGIGTGAVLNAFAFVLIALTEVGFQGFGAVIAALVLSLVFTMPLGLVESGSRDGRGPRAGGLGVLGVGIGAVMAGYAFVLIVLSEVGLKGFGAVVAAFVVSLVFALPFVLIVESLLGSRGGRGHSAGGLGVLGVVLGANIGACAFLFRALVATFAG
ncbi:unnamed protein product [Vitrella brassicaformis CCMP3155]|uniref:Amino acid transporter transmembrane domain-containing protein n=1 Tax=Vitrella brassicaformis (strain CCMP3155) TaxID=1169540 RepID=A0A0G4GQ18_VITBC|nr:unnamed protein product [Vitrella brassicaformis CCMP3155]|eukprot:CEM32477.1 unnamed protein product [Vitrella brassicaformis CCMP3155]